MDVKTAISKLRNCQQGRGIIMMLSCDLWDIADFIEQQEKYAELGRLAVECSATNKFPCQGKYDNDICYETLDMGCCEYEEFCQKRAELEGVE